VKARLRAASRPAGIAIARLWTDPVYALCQELGLGRDIGSGTDRIRQETEMGKRELIEPHQGDKRYQRRNQDGTFGESDDQSRSLGRDVRQHARASKPEGQGDRGD
jgi:hypothetical protein